MGANGKAPWNIHVPFCHDEFPLFSPVHLTSCQAVRSDSQPALGRKEGSTTLACHRVTHSRLRQRACLSPSLPPYLTHPPILTSSVDSASPNASPAPRHTHTHKHPQASITAICHHQDSLPSPAVHVSSVWLESEQLNSMWK